MRNKLISLVKSRRFYFAVIAILIVLCKDFLNLDQDTSFNISLVLMAWIVGDSLNKTE